MGDLLRMAKRPPPPPPPHTTQFSSPRGLRGIVAAADRRLRRARASAREVERGVARGKLLGRLPRSREVDCVDIICHLLDKVLVLDEKFAGFLLTSLRLDQFCSDLLKVQDSVGLLQDSSVQCSVGVSEVRCELVSCSESLSQILELHFQSCNAAFVDWGFKFSHLSDTWYPSFFSEKDYRDSGSLVMVARVSALDEKSNGALLALSSSASFWGTMLSDLDSRVSVLDAKVSSLQDFGSRVSALDAASPSDVGLPPPVESALSSPEHRWSWYDAHPSGPPDLHPPLWQQLSRALGWQAHFDEAVGFFDAEEWSLHDRESG